jgi:hypothetical protein
LECIQTEYYKKFLALLDNRERLALAASIAERFAFVRPIERQVRLALLIKAKRSGAKPTKSSTTRSELGPLVKPNTGVFAMTKEDGLG